MLSLVLGAYCLALPTLAWSCSMKKISLGLIATDYYTTSLMLMKQPVIPFSPKFSQMPDDKVYGRQWRENNERVPWSQLHLNLTLAWFGLTQTRTGVVTGTHSTVPSSLPPAVIHLMLVIYTNAASFYYRAVFVVLP